MKTDAQLLMQFTEAGAEDAFTELVDRYLDLVYSAAVRQVGGDAHLARDIAQGVFTALARKASVLPRNVILGGWLYRHTCFLARQALRTESRRRRREQEAAHMNQLDQDAKPSWEHMTAALDAAMQQLSARERDALILRYFERRSLTSVAAALGTGEEAAKKRLSRGLERLRVYFRRRGIMFSCTAALGSLLTVNAVKAAPLAWKTTVSASALANASLPLSGVAYWLAKLMALSRSRVAVPGVVWCWEWSAYCGGALVRPVLLRSVSESN